MKDLYIGDSYEFSFKIVKNSLKILSFPVLLSSQLITRISLCCVKSDYMKPTGLRDSIRIVGMI